MLATWLARLGVKTRIVDKRFDRINSGYVFFLLLRADKVA